MSNELKPCPHCGGTAFNATVEHSKEQRPNGYIWHGLIMCIRCQATAGTTGFDLTHDEALEKATSAWNRRKPTTEPVPLSLEELKQMDGEPVWIKEIEEWAIVLVDSIGNYAGMPFAKGRDFEYDIGLRQLTCYAREPRQEN